MTKQIKRLLRAYRFATIEAYYDYIIISHVNGNFTQVRSLFIELPRINRTEFLQSLISGLDIENWEQSKFEVLKYCIKLIY